jgi:hypothetical protein
MYPASSFELRDKLGIYLNDEMLRGSDYLFFMASYDGMFMFHFYVYEWTKFEHKRESFNAVLS